MPATFGDSRRLPTSSGADRAPKTVHKGKDVSHTASRSAPARRPPLWSRHRGGQAAPTTARTRGSLSLHPQLIAANPRQKATTPRQTTQISTERTKDAA